MLSFYCYVLYNMPAVYDGKRFRNYLSKAIRIAIKIKLNSIAFSLSSTKPHINLERFGEASILWLDKYCVRVVPLCQLDIWAVSYFMTNHQERFYLHSICR